MCSKCSKPVSSTKNFYLAFIQLVQQVHAAERLRIQESIYSTKFTHSLFTYIGKESLLSRNLPTEKQTKLKATFVGPPGIGKNTLIYQLAHDQYLPSLGWMPYVLNCL